MKPITPNKLQQAIILALSSAPLLWTATPTFAGIREAENIGVYNGTPLTVDKLTTPFKAFADYGALNQGWTHSAQFMTLTVGSEAEISSGKTFDVQLTMRGRGSLGNAGAAAIDNPAFALWTAGTGKLSPEQAFGQHGWNPTRGPNEAAINVAGAADKLTINDTLRLVGVLDGHVGWIGYVNAGPTYTMDNQLDPLGGQSLTLSGKSVLDTVSHGGLNTTSNAWLTNPGASSTAYTNNYFLQGDAMTGTVSDSATMTLYGLKSGRYLIATGGSCPTTPAPKTVCGVGSQFTFTVQPIPSNSVQFTDENSIPDNTDLTTSLKTLHDPKDKSQAFALDLQQEVLPAPTRNLLQQLQALPALASPGVSLVQTATGTLTVTVGNDFYALSPVKVIKTANEPAGISFTQDGQIKVVTNQQRMIFFNAGTPDVKELAKALLEINLAISSANAANGNLTLSLSSGLISKPYNALIHPAIKADIATLGTTPGLYITPYLSEQVANITIGYLLFNDASGKLRQQALLPVPADWESLRSTLVALNFNHVTLQTNGVISVTDSDGKISQGIMVYQVTSSNTASKKLTFNAAGDVNNDGQNDLQVSYPNGDKQTLILFKQPSAGNK